MMAAVLVAEWATMDLDVELGLTAPESDGKLDTKSETAKAASAVRFQPESSRKLLLWMTNRNTHKLSSFLETS